MPSQFFGLYIAGSGLRAANAALNTTANNIANAQTDGFSRQQVTQQANNALRVFATYGCAGAGVDTIAIERVRDNFYDVKYWNNNCKYGEYSAKSYYMSMVEKYLDDDGTSGFKVIFDKFSAALQSVTTNSSSETSKQQFIASAKSLTDYFNNMAGNLKELQKDINLEVKESVDSINAIAQKIATLNKQINTIELSGSRANELRDQRELLIDELSEYIDVDVTETQIADVQNASRDTNATRYVVRIAGGQVLVDGNDYKQLTYEPRDASEKVNQTDAETNFNGTVKDFQAGPTDPVTGKAEHTVTVEVTADYLKNMQDCTLSDSGGVINIGNKLFYYSDWKFNGVDPVTGNASYTFTFEEDPAQNKNTGLAAKAQPGKTVQNEKKIKYQGIPYYMEQMNAWIRGFAETVNKIFTSGIDANGNEGCIFFTGKKGNGEGQFDEDMLGDISKKGYYNLTAENFTINEALIKDASLLGTRSSKDVGVEECGKIEEMIEMLANKNIFHFRNGTAGQLLEAILSDAALSAGEANTFYDTYTGLKNTIDNQRYSISGVDEDEEAVSLVKFQNSYTLASKMIQTLTEVYDQLILRTGV